MVAQRSRNKAVLPAEMRAAVQQCNRGGRVEALGLDVSHLHAQQRGATRSVLHERVRGWLESEAGQAWQKERAALTQADDDDGQARG